MTATRTIVAALWLILSLLTSSALPLVLPIFQQPKPFLGGALHTRQHCGVACAARLRRNFPPLRSSPAPTPPPRPAPSALLVLSRRAFAFVLAPALVLSTGLEAYSRLGAADLRPFSDSAVVRWLGGLRSPSGSLAPLPEPQPGAKTLTVVFHGAGGPDSFTSELMSKVEEDASRNGGYCHFVDWSEYSTNLFKAAFNGQAVGRHAARSLREQLRGKEEPNVHLVGIR